MAAATPTTSAKTRKYARWAVRSSSGLPIRRVLATSGAAELAELRVGWPLAQGILDAWLDACTDRFKMTKWERLYECG